MVCRARVATDICVPFLLCCAYVHTDQPKICKSVIHLRAEEFIFTRHLFWQSVYIQYQGRGDL